MKKGAELGGNGEEEKGNEGREDSYSALKSKKISQGELVSATSDDNLKEILREVRTSKLPAVINYGASWFVDTAHLFLYFDVFVCIELNDRTAGTHAHQVFVEMLRWKKLIRRGNSGLPFFRCGVCSQILPTFRELSGKFPKVSFVYADIDECPETTQHIRYTPTFNFYRDGERVDEMFGVGEERLQDRLWLHS